MRASVRTSVRPSVRAPPVRASTNAIRHVRVGGVRLADHLHAALLLSDEVGAPGPPTGAPDRVGRDARSVVDHRLHPPPAAAVVADRPAPTRLPLGGDAVPPAARRPVEHLLGRPAALAARRLQQDAARLQRDPVRRPNVAEPAVVRAAACQPDDRRGVAGAGVAGAVTRRRAADQQERQQPTACEQNDAGPARLEVLLALGHSAASLGGARERTRAWGGGGGVTCCRWTNHRDSRPM